jgi:hypothetical protein
MYLGGPTKSPTPAEYAVLFVLGSASLIVLGVVAEVFALRLPPEDHERAVALGRFGLIFIGVGIGIALVFWLFRRLTD